MVAIGRDEHLRLVTKPPEGDAMNDPVTVPLENVARPTRARMIFKVETAARSVRMRRDAGWKAHSAATGTILSESGIGPARNGDTNRSQVVLEDVRIRCTAEGSDNQAGIAAILSDISRNAVEQIRVFGLQPLELAKSAPAS